MGLFSSNKKPTNQPSTETDNSVMELVNLAPLPAPPVEQPAPTPAPTQAQANRPRFGIEQAIQLLRSIPVEQNVELVVQVVKATLESLQVRVVDIVEDASSRQRSLEGRMGHLKSEITELEREILARRTEIASLETEHSEVSRAKTRLEMTERPKSQETPKPLMSPPTPLSPAPLPANFPKP